MERVAGSAWNQWPNGCGIRSEIGRRTSLSRNTIKKWLKEPGAEPKYRRNRTDGKLAPFESKLRLSLEADAHRPKRDRRTALMLFESLRKEDFKGSYSRVTAFVRNWRGQSAKLGAAFVPLKFELGEAFQFDWSEEWLMIGGIHRKILAAHLKLCASRAFLVSAYPTQSHEMLFDAHTRAVTSAGRHSPTRHLRQHEDRRGSRLARWWPHR